MIIKLPIKHKNFVKIELERVSKNPINEEKEKRGKETLWLVELYEKLNRQINKYVIIECFYLFKVDKWIS